MAAVALLKLFCGVLGFHWKANPAEGCWDHLGDGTADANFHTDYALEDFWCNMR